MTIVVVPLDREQATVQIVRKIVRQITINNKLSNSCARLKFRIHASTENDMINKVENE